MSKRGHTEEQILPSAAPGRGRHEDKRSLPRARHQRSDVLRVEEKVRGLGIELVLEEQIALTEELEKKTCTKVSWLFHRDGKPIRNYFTAWRSACDRAGARGRLVHFQKKRRAPPE